MPRKAEIVTKLSSQLMKFLLARSASEISMNIKVENDEISVSIEATVALKEQELQTLEGYLKVENREEFAYYYLPLLGEYGSDEDLVLMSMLVNSVKIDYNEEESVLRITFFVCNVKN
ncbi:hypothetical protein ACSFC1_00755 [Pseudothermotoga sp. U03pept]|uniref:hypothetical protein n=1 Tax=Pseudothermotoga sp. U03pept TaxID=3447012 RepID=UPI003F102677